LVLAGGFTGIPVAEIFVIYAWDLNGDIDAVEEEHLHGFCGSP